MPVPGGDRPSGDRPMEEFLSLGADDCCWIDRFGVVRMYRGRMNLQEPLALLLEFVFILKVGTFFKPCCFLQAAGRLLKLLFFLLPVINFLLC